MPGEAGYDPFIRGAHAVGVRALELRDEARGRVLPGEAWYPAQPAGDGAAAAAEQRDATPLPGTHPAIAFSPHAGGDRRASSFLCAHLASHGYVVAAVDHSELVAPELAPVEGETPAGRQARVEAIIGSRVPDLRLLLDHLAAGGAGVPVDTDRLGLAGHSFGGWTVLATTEADSRVRSLVALAPGGSSQPLPGVLPLTLTFAWGREVPTLYIAAEDDVPIPPGAVRELFERTPGARRMFVLRDADHQHFVDEVAAAHEAVRAMTLPGEAAWMPAAMRPMSELCPGEHGHLMVRGLSLAHFDATLRGSSEAARFLDGDVVGALAARGVAARAVGD